jgi:ubiquitin carboxyl-terminal hydrolase L3
MSEKKWFPLESNPEVMQKYLDSLGIDLEKCPFEFTDVFGLEEDLLSMTPQPCAAVLLVFSCNKDSEAYGATLIEKVAAEKAQQPEGKAPGSGAFFMKQTISNACGTIAILHAIANNTAPFLAASAIQPNGFIDRFLNTTKNQTPEERAKFLEGDESLEKAQAVAASEGQTSNREIDADINLHFVCFCRSPDGFLCEFDGCKPFPIPHSRCETQADVLPEAAKAIKKFLEVAGESVSKTLAITALSVKQ